MRAIINKIIFSITLFLLIQCNDVLQVEEQTAIDGDRVFNDPNLTKLYLNEIYGGTLPGWSATSNITLTEESVGRNNLIDGAVTEPTVANPDATLGSYSPSTFAKIRNINALIEQVDRSELSQNIKDSYIGQALFLRAWEYWNLVLQYGGVPIVTTVLDNNDEVSDALPRESAIACVDQIVSDLNDAMDLIVEYSDSDYGRITRSAAAAFKGRVLLSFASPQFDPNGISSAEGIQARWEAAYQANLEAKQIAESEGHFLHDDFSEIFLDEDNAEVILHRKYSSGLSTHTYENSVRPPSVSSSSSASASPSWDLAESFPMVSGLPIDDPGSGYDQESFWANRDPRFYATIGYNSIPWKFAGREDERQWIYLRNAQELEYTPPNGLYLKKHINTGLPITETLQTPTDWIEIRYAEILLNLAECANETGRQSEAYAELYAIRERAGIEPGGGNYGIPSGLNKVQLREVIMNERRIEFAFENKRYWDLRRRNLYVNGIDGTSGNGLNGTRRRAVITTVDTEFIITENPGLSIASDPADSAFNYFEAELLNTVDWDDPDNYANYFNTTVEEAEELDINYLQPKYNFFYLPLNALVRNENLEQTETWLNENGVEGTFDPLQE